MKTWPSRDSILEMCVACGERHGLDEKTRPGGMLGSWGWDKTRDSLSHDISLNYLKKTSHNIAKQQTKLQAIVMNWKHWCSISSSCVFYRSSQVQHLAGEIGGEGRHLEWGALRAWVRHVVVESSGNGDFMIYNGHATNDELASGF